MPAQENLILDEIMAVEEIGEFDTYECTIPDTHCYIANGILLHNSADIEGDLDSLIILSRERKRSISGEDVEGAFEPRTLIDVPASRYSSGGSTFLWAVDNECRFDEI